MVDRWLFLGGALCLDFVNTLRDRWAPVPTETLLAPRDLGAWFVAAGLAPAPVPCRSDDLERAVQLRIAVDHLLTGRGELGAAEAALVNDVSAAAPRPVLVAGAGLTPAVQTPAGGTPTELLGLVAADAVAVVQRHGAGAAKECAHPRCGLRYLDLSRGGRRRWCSMQRCGNRAKVQRHAQAS